MTSHYNEDKFQTLSMACRVHDLGPTGHYMICYLILLTAPLALPLSPPEYQVCTCLRLDDWFQCCHSSLRLKPIFQRSPSSIPFHSLLVSLQLFFIILACLMFSEHNYLSESDNSTEMFSICLQQLHKHMDSVSIDYCILRI